MTAATELEEPDLWPDFHRDLRQDIPGLPGPVVVHAPRGCGKTVLLRQVQGDQQLRIPIVPGKDGEAAVEQLRLYCARLEQEVAPGENLGMPITGVLVDDVDVLLLGPDRAGRPQSEVVSALHQLKRMVSTRGAMVVVTTSRHPATMLRFNRFISDFFTQGAQRQILPWSLDWETVVREALATRYREKFEREWFALWGHQWVLSADFIQTWCDCLRRLTGGHPGLLAVAMEMLAQQLTRSALKNPAAGKAGAAAERERGQRTEAVVAAIRAALDVRGGPDLLRRIEDLRDSRINADRQGFDYLCKVATAEEKGKAPASTDAATWLVLERDALAYMDRGLGRVRTMCELVREQVLTLGKARARSAPARISTPHGPPRGGIEVLVETEAGNVRLMVPGSAYRVLRALASHKGEIVHLNTLIEQTDMTRAAVLTAIHRLSEKLREHGLPLVLENVYGKGYRLKVLRLTTPDDRTMSD